MLTIFSSEFPLRPGLAGLVTLSAPSLFCFPDGPDTGHWSARERCGHPSHLLHGPGPGQYLTQTLTVCGELRGVTVPVSEIMYSGNPDFDGCKILVSRFCE